MTKGENKIRNVGPKSAAWLRQIGVHTIEDLRRLGPVEVYLKAKRAGFKVGKNLLYALAGALEDCHWTNLSKAEKERLSILVDAAEEKAALAKKQQGRRSFIEEESSSNEDQQTEPETDSGFLDDPNSGNNEPHDVD